MNDTEKSSFWNTLENILRPQAKCPNVPSTRANLVLQNEQQNANPSLSNDNQMDMSSTSLDTFTNNSLNLSSNLDQLSVSVNLSRNLDKHNNQVSHHIVLNELLNNFNDQQQFSSTSDEIFKRLNVSKILNNLNRCVYFLNFPASQKCLKSSEPIQIRLQNLEELVKLSELFSLNEVF